VHQEVITCLFDEEKDPSAIMKWKGDLRLPRGDGGLDRGRLRRDPGVVLKHA